MEKLVHKNVSYITSRCHLPYFPWPIKNESIFVVPTKVEKASSVVTVMCPCRCRNRPKTLLMETRHNPNSFKNT
jgi:hypothetical protein